jgi:hypothetical protein
VAREYIERMGGLPEDSLDRLWLSIANDLEQLAGKAP